MSFREYLLAEEVSVIRSNRERWYWGENKIKYKIYKKIMEDEVNEQKKL